MRRLAAGLLLSLTTLLAGALVVEGVLRLLGERPRPSGAAGPPAFTIDADTQLILPDDAAGYRYGPGTFVVAYASGDMFRLRHGADGLRVTGPSTAVDDARPQLWILGCSFTHGWAVDDDQTYPWLVQAALPALRVRNFGVGGYGTLQSWLRFEAMLAAGEKPAAVVVAYASFHDGRNTWTREWSRSLGPQRLPRAVLAGSGFCVVRGVPHYRPLPLVHRSALMNRFEAALDRVEDHAIRHSRAVNLAILQAFADRCRAEGIDFLVAGIQDDHPTRRTLADCRRRGIDTVDIAVDLTREEYRNAYDPHPSPAAHAAYAARLIPALPRRYNHPRSVANAAI